MRFCCPVINAEYNCDPILKVHPFIIRKLILILTIIFLEVRDLKPFFEKTTFFADMNAIYEGDSYGAWCHHYYYRVVNAAFIYM